MTACAQRPHVRGRRELPAGGPVSGPRLRTEALPPSCGPLRAACGPVGRRAWAEPPGASSLDRRRALDTAKRPRLLSRRNHETVTMYFLSCQVFGNIVPAQQIINMSPPTLPMLQHSPGTCPAQLGRPGVWAGLGLLGALLAASHPSSFQRVQPTGSASTGRTAQPGCQLLSAAPR